MVILERRPICLYEIGGTILLSQFERRMVDLFYSCPKLCWRLAGVSFLWSKLYLKGRLSRSNYLIGVALDITNK